MKRTKPNIVKKSAAIPALFLFTLALAFRLVFLFQLAETPFYHHHFSDSSIYVELSKGILQGAPEGKAYFMSPLYPMFLGIVSSVFGDLALWARLLQAVMGAGAAALVYLAGRRAFDEWAGRAAGAIIALYPLCIFYDASILLESLQVVAASAAILLLLQLDEKRRSWLFAGLGAVVGILAVNRFSMILLLPALIIFFLLRYKKEHGLLLRIAAFTASCLLVIAPFTIRNAGAEGVLVPVTSSGGLNFYAGNNSESNGAFRLPPQVDLYADPNGEKYVESAVGRDLSSTEVSDYWMNKGGKWASEHPMEFIQGLWTKALLFLSPSETDQLGLSLTFFRNEYDTILDWLFPGFAALFALALFGFIRERKNPRISSLLLFLALPFATSVLFFANGRMRMVAIPALSLLAGVGIARLLQFVKRREWKPLILPASVSAGIVAAVMVLQPGYRPTFEMEYNRLGLIAFDKKDYAQAEDYFRRSVAEKPTARAFVNVGNACSVQRKFEEGERAYRQAILLDSAYVQAYFNYGNLLVQTGRPKEAYAAWLKCIRLERTFAPAYKNIGIVLMQAGKYPDALDAFTRYYNLESDASQREAALRDIRTLQELTAPK